MRWTGISSLGRPRPLSLRLRLGIGVIAIVLVTTLGLASTALFFVKRHMQASIAQEQFARISAMADAVDEKFIGRRVLLRTFSASVQTLQLKDSAGLQEFLVAHQKPLRESFDNVAFLDAKGDLVANLNGAARIGMVNVADRPYFIDTVASKSGVISQPYVNRLNAQAQIAVTQPVLDADGAVRWIISGSINLTEENFLGELAKVKFGKTGYMFVVNRDGIVIDHPQNDRILKHVDAFGSRNEASSRAIAGFEGVTEAMNRFGVYGLYAFKQTQQTNWVMGSIYPRAEAFQEINRIEKLAWGGALLLTMLAGGLTLIVLNRQLAPLTRLHDHMQHSRALATYTPTRDMPSQPEIRDMAHTFDTLMLEREEAQNQLLARESRLSSILKHAPDAYVSIDASGVITEWNRQAEHTFGWTKEEALGKSLPEVLIPAAQRHAHTAGFDKFVRTGTGPVVDHRQEMQALHKDGHEIPVELSIAAIRQGDAYAANAFLRDITERRQAQAELAASEKRVRDIADHVPALIGYFDADLNMHFANGPARRLFGMDALRRYDMQSALGHATYQQHAPHLAKVLAGERVSFEAASVQGADQHYQAHMVPDVGDDGVVKGFYTMTFDVSELKRAERKLIELSRVDALTQLPNRRGFLEKVDEALARCQRNGRAMALMYLDIDSFKQINDTHGHGVGDDVLIGFSRRLQIDLRQTDTVARLAGDEFVIILEGLQAPGQAEIVAAKLVATIRKPMLVQNDLWLSVTASIGVAVVDSIERSHERPTVLREILTATDLIAHADRALYEAKRAGRNGFYLVTT